MKGQYILGNKWKYTEEVIDEFKRKNQNRSVITLDEMLMDINPQRIIAINNVYEYPEILDDYKMINLKKSVENDGWINKGIGGFSLLMLPNGDLIVNGGGNHRAVLSKELQISSVKAMVARVVYDD